MMYCNSCGQCHHISRTDFIEISYTSGWESSYIDCIHGDYTDSGDGETTESNHACYECPHCTGEDVTLRAEPTEEEALETRADYDRTLQERRERNAIEAIERKKIEEANKASREWDVTENV